MSELLPSTQGNLVKEGLTDYLRTTFALADDDVGQALEDFLSDPDSGVFKGPYLRLRLPFQAAADGWRNALEWYEGPTPYGHQAAAFARLTSANLSLDKPRPLPTLVTTGTGSGKTEAFLYPIIDHVLRAKRNGITGMKALILYPMNALANDQADRLAVLLSSHPELAGITAALYTGQKGKQRTVVSSDGLITDRTIIRDEAPDILLTNYKMLDQMLLRHADARIWEQSATSLQYLVLDEFHTYDGAQGTDVSMLLRRVGLALKSYWDDDSVVTADDWARPLGRVTPIATSATLGSEEDPTRMLNFARTVFGEGFGSDAVITESRQEVDEWIDSQASQLQPARLSSSVIDATLTELSDVDLSDGRRISEAVLGILFSVDGVPVPMAQADDTEMLAMLKAHPLTRELAIRCGEAVGIANLAAALPGDAEQANDFLLAFIAVLSHVRAQVGREALSVDLHLWVRELTRIDRAASLNAEFSWSDDGDRTHDELFLPAIYCRLCGRSGWGAVLAPTGLELSTSDEGIRAKKLSQDQRFRPLIFAPREGEAALTDSADVKNLAWLFTAERRISTKTPEDEVALREGTVLPVLTHLGDDAADLSRDDWCPSCERRSGIRFLGSATATMLSVALSTIFGTPGLDKREKKSLVFTDSVQDAAHRAGFVQSRSHSLTLRSLIRDALGGETVTLDELVDRIVSNCGDDRHRRYRVIAPDLADREEFMPFWQAETLKAVPRSVQTRVRRRLLFDVQNEFGLRSRVGRTLELTGTATAHVDVSPKAMLAVARRVLHDAAAQPLAGLTISDRDLLSWVRGTLERMRERGAIAHEWFRKYQQSDGNRYSIWGGRPKDQGMPAFPRGRAAPAYPRIGSGAQTHDSDLDPVTNKRSWYAQWTSRALGLPAAESGVLARLLFEGLAKLGVLDCVKSDSGAAIYQLPSASILVNALSLEQIEDYQHRLVCNTCHTDIPGDALVIAQLTNAPCIVTRCAGRLEPARRDDNFYRRMYESTDIQRVVAREHTSQLQDDVRLAYEKGFKTSDSNPDSPNVLVATPTLEMGIDIGDLSTIMLASLPRSVSSYLQRVGRAGRLTGNALNLAFVTGRGDQLPKLGDPLSVINGDVVPPATYLDADEILRRQYTASVADRLARSASSPHPVRTKDAMSVADSDSYLRTVISQAEENAEQYLADFLNGFPALGEESVESLRVWASPGGGADSSGLAKRLYTEARKWRDELESLRYRIEAITGQLSALEAQAASPAATDEDKVAARTAKAELKIAKKTVVDLSGEYWISVLEQFGILPNYTLFDDSVTLDVAFSWIDPDTGSFESDDQTFSRASALALRELAPGARFYGRGYRVEVDAVDLGPGAELVESLIVCPACGYLQRSGEAPVAACPRCESQAFADVSQRIKAVELKRVSSAMRREEAGIDDSRDERDRERFTILPMADVDTGKIVQQWFVQDYGFGVRYLRDMTIRWVNLGKSGGQGSPRLIGGSELSAPLFRVCSHCGQLDGSPGKNSPREHRPWCPNRNGAEESNQTIALTRQLETEGLVVRLPTLIALGDRYAVPSLAAGLLLGLRELIGGSPDHLAVEVIKDPAVGHDSENYDALLLHDLVPGGTGYLTDLADPDEFREVIYRAWKVLVDCPCADEGRAACHRCLLPFAAPGQTDSVSRVAAERHLRDILLAGQDGEVESAAAWELTDVAVQAFDPETQIEKKFRAVLQARLAAAGINFVEQPGPNGNRLVFRVGPRQWRVEPQENLGGARPDFVLRCDQPLPAVAIFCDGWQFHASPLINRIADDAQKRRDLRDSGHMVLGICWADLVDAETTTTDYRPWFNAGAASLLRVDPAVGLMPQYADLAGSGPIDFIITWVQQPDVDQVELLANWFPYFALSAENSASMALDTDLSLEAIRCIDGTRISDGEATMWSWTSDTVSLVSRHLGGELDNVELAVVLDDRESELGHSHKDAWRDWLRISNLVNLRTRETKITVRSLVGKAIAEGVATEATKAVPAGWEEIFSTATKAEREVLAVLAVRGVAKPAMGFEAEGGLPTTISWPSQLVAVDVDFDDSEVDELTREGWTVVSPNIDEILSVLNPNGSEL